MSQADDDTSIPTEPLRYFTGHWEGFEGKNVTVDRMESRRVGKWITFAVVLRPDEGTSLGEAIQIIGKMLDQTKEEPWAVWQKV